jgi:hypothetical protein
VLAVQAGRGPVLLADRVHVPGIAQRRYIGRPDGGIERIRGRTPAVEYIVHHRVRAAGEQALSGAGWASSEVPRQPRRHRAPHQVRLGKPCSSSTGGPEPPRRAKTLVRLVWIVTVSKASKVIATEAIRLGRGRP